MNALVPAFVAILLAELGGALAFVAGERRKVAALVMILLVTAAVVGGWWVSAMVIAPARVLMLGLALLFAGIGQFGQKAAVAGKPALIASGLTLYRSPTPFLAFALAAAISAPVSAGIGAFAGVTVATAIASARVVVPRVVRRICGTVLCLAGLFAALDGLRLV